MDNIKFKRSLYVDFLMVFLALVSLIILVFEAVSVVSPEYVQIFLIVDFCISFIFLIEFIYNMHSSHNSRLFLRKYWWELLACIPIPSHITSSLRVFKLARIVYVFEAFRITRLFVRLKMIMDLSKKFTRQTYMIYIVLVLTVILTIASLGFYNFEHGVNPKVNTIFDGIWWAIVTITTIGYGDIYPITFGGRIIAILLMFTGIGTLGVFIAIIDMYVFKSSLLANKHHKITPKV